MDVSFTRTRDGYATEIRRDDGVRFALAPADLVPLDRTRLDAACARIDRARPRKAPGR